MHSNKTVILGEAPESDSEEISLDDDNDESKSTLAKLAGNLSAPKFAPEAPNSPLTSSGSSLSNKSIKANNLRVRPTKYPHISLLHETLYSKNQQLYNSLAHLHRHPYEKASKDFHTISQKLVNMQKIIQDVDVTISKIKKDQDSLDVDIKMITQDSVRSSVYA